MHAQTSSTGVGVDKIRGGTGNDFILVGEGNDIVADGPSNDFISLGGGGDGDDTLIIVSINIDELMKYEIIKYYQQ